MSLYCALLGYRDLAKLLVESFWFEIWRFKHVQTRLNQMVLYVKHAMRTPHSCHSYGSQSFQTRWGLYPSVITCSSLISACERGGRWQEALHLLEELPAYEVSWHPCNSLSPSYMVLREGCTVIRKLPWNSRSIWNWINSGASKKSRATKEGMTPMVRSLQYEAVWIAVPFVRGN